MAEELRDDSEIRETDIVFDCPHCGKSLAIDYRGAGLTIPCSDCGRDVAVPIPEGMSLADLDSSEEEQEMRILNLRRSLSAAEFRIQQLENEVHELSSRRDSLEQGRTDSLFKIGTIQEKLGTLQSLLDEAFKSVSEIANITKKNS